MWNAITMFDSTASIGEYRRRPALVLLNGLAEQVETWFCNVSSWRRHFDVHTPNLAAYDGPVVHRRIADGDPIDVAFLVEQLRLYLDTFVLTPPYHLAASSMGGKTAVEFALRYPDLVGRLVLICPSGLSETESLPIVDGVRRSDIRAVVESIFQDSSCVVPEIIEFYRERVRDKRWRSGLLRTIRGTMPHNVRDRVGQLTCPTLVVVGEDDRIVRPEDSIEAGRTIPDGKLIVIPNCGHAPQIERAELVNRMVVDFLCGTDALSEDGLEFQESDFAMSMAT